MTPHWRRHLPESSPHIPVGIVTGTLIRILLAALLTVGAMASAFAQARPQIVWMRGANAGGVSQIALSPDGQNFAVCGHDGTTKIRRISDGMLLETLVDYPGTLQSLQTSAPAVTSIAYTPDGTKIVTGSTGSVIQLWDLSTGLSIHTWIAPASVNSVAVSPDGKTLAAAMTTHDILLWNLADFSSAGTLGGHTSSVNALAFSPDSKRLASASSDGTVRIWDVATTVQVWSLTDGSSVGSVAFAADNVTVCSGDTNGDIKVWNTTTGGAARRTITGASGGFGSQSVALAISHDSTRVTAGFAQRDTKLHSWNISTGVSVGAPDTTFPIYALAYSSDGSQVYVSDNADNVSVWNASGLTAAGTIPPPFPGSVGTVAINSAGTTLATGSTDGLVKFWNPLTGALTKTVAPTSATQINTITFSRDGAQLAISGLIPGSFGNSTGIVWIYKLSDSTFRQITLSANSLAFSADGALLAAAVGNTINIYNSANFALVHTISVGSTVDSIVISPDGTKLASGSDDGKTRIYDFATYNLLQTLSNHPNRSVRAVSFSPDNLSLVDACDDMTSVLSRVADGMTLHTFTHTATVETAVFSPDGKQVTTGDIDRHLKIWNASSGSLLYDYVLETGSIASGNSATGVTDVVYAPDGKLLAYGRSDATVAVAANPLFVPLITGLTLNPTSVVGGTSTTGTVTLNSTTLAGGAVVSLSSDNLGVASLPFATVTVPQGSATATFTVNTSGVSSTSVANITASLSGSSASAALTVTPATLSGLTVSPTSVRGGQNSTGTVSFTGPAPAGGTVVTLASNNANASVPASVKVAAGSSSATFSITTSVVGVQNMATISATFGTTAQANLTITPPIVTALSTSPANLKGGLGSTGTVTISDPAPSGGILVLLSSNNIPVASTVASVTVAAGATTATFAITTHTVSAITGVTFTGTFNGSSQTTVLTVTPPTLTSLTLSPASVKGSKTSTGTVTLSDPAPSDGVVVTLASGNAAVTLPALVTVASGSATATFTANTTPVPADTDVTLTASFNNQNQTAVLTVQAPSLVSLVLNPASVRALNFSSGTVTLDVPAPSAGTTVSLNSQNTTEATVPASVKVSAGQTTATYPVASRRVTQNTTVTLTATLSGIVKSADLAITPHLPFDFDNDGYNDLVFQTNNTGLIAVWFMNGLSVLGGSTVDTLPQAGWKVVGVGDFDHSGTPDLVLQNQTSGRVVIWYLNGTTLLGGEETSFPPGADYKVVGVADFNNDGWPDLLFQNQTNGQIVVWFMNGSQVVGGAVLPTQPFAGYKVVGVGDFNKDGQPDILFQNEANNQVVVWYMNGIAFSGGGAISYFPPSVWQVKGVADYNNDGWPDIVFQNSSTRQVITWFMNGLTVTGGDLITTQPPSPYLLVGPH